MGADPNGGDFGEDNILTDDDDNDAAGDDMSKTLLCWTGVLVPSGLRQPHFEQIEQISQCHRPGKWRVKEFWNLVKGK